MEPRKCRLLFWGFGLMNQLALGISVLAKPMASADIVAVIDRNSARKGKRVGYVIAGNETAASWFGGGQPKGALPESVADLVIGDPADAANVIRQTKPDIIMLATRAFIKEIEGQLSVCIDCGVDVICIAEELLFPWECDVPETAAKLEEKAKAKGVRILGTGFNDTGWCIPAQTVAGMMINMSRIEASITWDCRDYGRAVSEYQGVTLTPDEFQTQIVEPSLTAPSVDSPAVYSIARGLSLTPAEGTLRHEFSPVLAKTRLYSSALGAWVEPGRVKGCTVRCIVDTHEGVTVVCESVGFIFGEDPSLTEGEDVTVTAWGDVPEKMVLKGKDVKGRVLTCTPMVNRIPQLLAQEPGWVTPDMLAPPPYLAKGVPKIVLDGTGIRRAAK
ncbi:hypothetical protein M427DRAFT_32995 [Gonapodya prolifera JEL478]|uniref:2,4-diaminopentanoate dehydrogenase C-terminal domain-containing protein n=1 Tax=Gonapodya prolifera (strain JEL478) TaxID=1344416 RepID=A0A139AD73_GONPJ|nr:hypothetical protein M427DRAFT_32995 [Gonapodya prolifera JEL478]|eukprot:KXS14534.1 hypothetical protein M427DRAFT_32995 [Gonapodya prolifera JEL478]